MQRDRNGLEVVGESECVELLRSASIGRVGLSVGALPVILPVTFALLDGDVVFRSAPGSKLLAAASNQVVCFEVDGIDAERREGWSVLVTGRTELLSDDAQIDRARRLPMGSWLPVPYGPYVRIRSQMISGRRLVPAAMRVPAPG